MAVARSRLHRALPFFVPAISATVALLLLSAFGFRENRTLIEQSLGLAISGVAKTQTEVATDINGQLIAAERSVARYAAALSNAVSEISTEAIPSLARNFDALVERGTDGVYRSRKASYDPERDAAILVPPSTALTDRIKAFFFVSGELTKMYGLGARDASFVSTYILPSINGGVLFWPSEPNYIYDAKPDYSYLETDWVTLANPSRNPGGKPLWTPALYDPLPKKVLLSVIAPIWFHGEWFGSAGHDLPVDNLLQHAAALSRLPGSRFVIVNSLGIVLASDKYREQIIVSNGELRLGSLNDEGLAAAMARIGDDPVANAKPMIIGSDIAFVTPIASQNWWLISAVPSAGIVGPIEKSFARLQWIVVATFLLEVLLATSLFIWTSLATRRHVKELQTMQLELANANRSLEASVNERTAELRQAVADLNTFNFTVSHDLRSPLRHIVSFLSLIKSDEDNKMSDDSRNALVRCLAATDRMQTMITDLLQFAQIGKHGVEAIPIRVAVVLNELLPELKNAYPNTQISVDDMPTVLADHALLTQILRNFLDNACKYSSKVSTPIVSVAAEQLPDGNWQITVTDNGAGFDPAYADKLFQLFQRLHRNDEFVGTGVGLAAAARAAQVLGGQVSARSQLGAGAQFSVVLRPAN